MGGFMSKIVRLNDETMLSIVGGTLTFTQAEIVKITNFLTADWGTPGWVVAPSLNSFTYTAVKDRAQNYIISITSVIFTNGVTASSTNYPKVFPILLKYDAKKHEVIF